MHTSLRLRITVSIIIFVVVLISAFTVVQLQNQLRVITVFNSLKAKLTSHILKDSLEKNIANLEFQANPSRAISKALNSLKASELIDVAYVYSLKGQVIASVGSMTSDIIEDSVTLTRIEEARQCALSDKQFCSYIYKGTRTLQLYFPITVNDSVLYVARLDISLGNMATAMGQVYGPVIIIACLIIVASLFFAMVLTKRVIGPISLLNTATKEVAAGDLSLRIHMNTKDELEELADTFNVMAIELKKMKAKAENANPLTKLPGNIVIQEKVEKRIAENHPFTLLYCDLDNFKAFNDKYGIQKGDDAIKLTASIFKEAIEKHGSKEDFIGHEGGDDFLLLTTPEKHSQIGDYIAKEFDKRIRAFYDKDDLGRGYIEAKARHGDEIQKFPVMTISLAGITNEARPFGSYAEVTNVAAEMKKKAKDTPGSCLVMDRRKTPWPPNIPRPS